MCHRQGHIVLCRTHVPAADLEHFVTVLAEAALRVAERIVQGPQLLATGKARHSHGEQSAYSQSKPQNPRGETNFHNFSSAQVIILMDAFSISPSLSLSLSFPRYLSLSLSHSLSLIFFSVLLLLHGSLAAASRPKAALAKDRSPCSLNPLGKILASIHLHVANLIAPLAI